MRTRFRGTLLFALIALVGACADQHHLVAPPSFSLSAGATDCPTPANVVVHDEAGLLAALSTAYPGEVIGLDGFFGIRADVTIATPGVTLTCVTPGSGLFAVPGGSVGDMLIAGAPKVTVDHLALDATQALEGPYLSMNGLTFFADSTRFTNNTVTCSPAGLCALLVGGRGDIISDNSFTSPGSWSGVHLQVGGVPLDGARIERNTIVATAPSWGRNQGGIRVYRAAHLVIADNVVTGPWQNAFSPTALGNSQVQGNQLQGALRNGIRLSAAIPSNLAGTRVSGNVFRNNLVGGAGQGGIYAYLACSNVFVGNDLQGNAGNIGLIFPDSSGANTFVGNGTIVVNDGVMDCDGDGVSDPNIITGAGAVLHGVNLGQIVSDALVRQTHGITLQ